MTEKITLEAFWLAELKRRKYLVPASPYQVFDKRDRELLARFEVEGVREPAIRQGIIASLDSHRNAYPRVKKRPTLRYCRDAIRNLHTKADYLHDPCKRDTKEEKTPRERAMLRLRMAGSRLLNGARKEELPVKLRKRLNAEADYLFVQADVLAGSDEEIETVNAQVEAKQADFTDDLPGLLGAETVARLRESYRDEVRSLISNASEKAVRETADETFTEHLLEFYKLPEEWI